MEKVSACKIKRSISGNIGVGKTTQCQKLADKFTNGEFVKEPLDNPHLPDYY